MHLFPAEPLFYIIGLPTVFLIGVGKGAFGGGLAIIGLPLLSLVVDPLTASIMMAPLASATDPFGVMAFPPRTWSWPDLLWLLPGIVAGVTLGAVFFVAIDPRLVAVTMAVITLIFTARYLLRSRKTAVAHSPIRPTIALGCATVSGFTTFLAHAGNPPVAFYMLSRGLPKTIYAGTMIAFFLVGNTVKLLLYLWVNGNDTKTLLMAVSLMPVIPFGIWAGKILHDRMDQQQLFFWCYVLVGAAGLNLLATSVRGYLG